MALAVDATYRPTSVHGAAIPHQFWVEQGEDDDDVGDGGNLTSEEEDLPSTPEFVKAAVDEGFIAH